MFDQYKSIPTFLFIRSPKRENHIKSGKEIMFRISSGETSQLASHRPKSQVSEKQKKQMEITKITDSLLSPRKTTSFTQIGTSAAGGGTGQGQTAKMERRSGGRERAREREREYWNSIV